MMASSILLGVEARLAKTDAVLLACSVAAMGAMARIYLAHRSCAGLPGRLATAGDLVDGDGRRRADQGAADPDVRRPDRDHAVDPRPLGALAAGRCARSTGFIWMLLLVLPWFVAIVLRSGDSFFAQAIGHDMLAKVAGGQEAHGAPPGYYLLLFWVTFWPGSVLAGLAAPAVWRARREPGAQFLLAWLIPSWIVFEAVITKLPHYVLPLYPAIAILIAGVLERGDAGQGALAGARHRRLVCVSRHHRRCGAGRLRHRRPAISASSPGRSRRRR